MPKPTTAKRDSTLRERGLDMADAADALNGPTITIEDDRRDYGEIQYITISLLADRMVLLAWTPRESAHRIISTRKANHRERALHERRLR
ncbi:MAG: BrnT family toxin [Rhodospirillales bacterium]|nr:BrnT family toxin [Rhodospirillales bacterium]